MKITREDAMRMSIVKSSRSPTYIVFMGGKGNLSEKESRHRTIKGAMRKAKQYWKAGSGHLWVRTPANCVGNGCSPIVRLTTGTADDPKHNAVYLGEYKDDALDAVFIHLRMMS